MANKDEKERRRSILKRLQEQNRQLAAEDRPISLLDLGDLFDFLDEHLTTCGCNHTLDATRRFLGNRNLDHEKIVPWLATSGGYCDCEVLANVEDAWNEEIETARGQS